MKPSNLHTVPIVTIATDRCKRCYSCVRGCPAKAIRVREGQAEVIKERCIGCGQCVRVCSQGVKRITDNLPAVLALLRQGNAVVMVAPSFPAAFPDLRPGQVIAALRHSGFCGVFEVAFGADLVSREYQRLYNEDPSRTMISTPCPATVAYIQKFADELLPLLAPILSPMAAMGKALKTRLQPGCSTVFLGPCTAKVCEIQDPEVAPWVDAVMTFTEVFDLFRNRDVNPAEQNDEEFDPPHSWMGSIYPVAGGLVQVSELPAGVDQNAVYQVVGRGEFIDLVNKLKQRIYQKKMSALETRFFDVLFCQGCIEGPAMPEEESLVRRKERIIDFLKSRKPVSRSIWENIIKDLSDLDLSRSFKSDKQDHDVPDEDEIRRVLAMTNKWTPEQELNCGACGYRSCREKAIAVINGIAEVEMCLPHMIEKLEATIGRLHLSHEQLETAQVQLIRSERLASMGQMAAGIAHEVNNPLGTIVVYSHLIKDNPLCPPELKSDLDMILKEATRCRNIVSGLLNFSRQSKAVISEVDIRQLIDGAAEILRSQAQGTPIEIEVTAESGLPLARVDRDQIHQVLVNLMKNAWEAMPSGGKISAMAVWNERTKEYRISIRDTGPGILPENMAKLFSPFFTTKPVGKGTGLGLSICYGIIKMHHGRILARNNDPAPGATFDVFLPSAPPEKEGVML
jgi:two-component system NtrC family sensor kinase